MSYVKDKVWRRGENKLVLKICDAWPLTAVDLICAGSEQAKHGRNQTQKEREPNSFEVGKFDSGKSQMEKVALRNLFDLPSLVHMYHTLFSLEYCIVENKPTYDLLKLYRKKKYLFPISKWLHKHNLLCHLYFYIYN